VTATTNELARIFDVTDPRVVDLADARDAALDLLQELQPGAPAPPETTNGVVALAGDQAVALLPWGRYAGFDGVTEAYLGIMARPGVDGSEVAGRLVAAALRRIEGRPCRAWMYVDDAQSYLREILPEHGFEHRFTSCLYEGPLPLPSLTPRPEARLATYRGGDPAADAAMEDLHRRGFRGRIGVPEWVTPSPESSKHHILAWDGDRLAGFVSWIAMPEFAVWDNVVLARRYYGTGMAHTLGGAISDAAVAAGCSTLRGYVHATNHASRSLAERFGLRVCGETRAFLRELSA